MDSAAIGITYLVNSFHVAHVPLSLYLSLKGRYHCHAKRVTEAAGGSPCPSSAAMVQPQPASSLDLGDCCNGMTCLVTCLVLNYIPPVFFLSFLFPSYSSTIVAN